MKKLGSILSLYILLLAFMPCMDDEINCRMHREMKMEQANNSQQNDIDLCSPFCPCNCCGSVMENQNTSFDITHFEFVSAIQVELLTPLTLSPSAAVWQPPELG